jgi:hypothetical protein
MPDKDGYPTKKELEKIKNWDILNNDIQEFLEYIRSIWRTPDWGFSLKGKRILKLELHTGGWSGNEEIMYALQHNYLFWGLYWRKSLTGGHYYFRIKLYKRKVVRK